ncbi:MAG: cache domain-containing protein, partial [Planctomycetota bacterium]
MKIRSKLLILLLTVSLLPVLITVFLTRFSIKRLSSQIARDIETKQFHDAAEGIKILIHNYREAVMGSNNSLRLALQLQAQEVEQRLADSAPKVSAPEEDWQFGFNPELEVPVERWLKEHPFSDSVSFQHQRLFLVGDTKPEIVKRDLGRLSTMTDVYHQLYQANRGRTLWHYTSLDNGLHTSYPGRETEALPDGYDPRERPWYTLAKESQGRQITASIIVDAVTEEPVLTLSMPVYYPKGKFAGVTAIDRQMKDYFDGLKT